MIGEGESVSALLQRLWRHLGRARRRQFVLLSGLMVVSAFAEIVSLGAVLPFIGVLTAPSRLFDRPWIAELARARGITTPEDLVLPLTATFVGAAIVAGAIRVLLLWVSTKIAVGAGADLSLEVYRRTLYQPYSVHVSRNNSAVISGVTSKVNAVVFAVLLPILTLISSAVLLVTITAALVFIDPLVACSATLAFAICYGLVSWSFRRRLRRNSFRIATEQVEVVKALQEGLGGIRDVLLDGAQPIYCDTYRRADRPLRDAEGNNVFLGQAPRFVMEAFGMVLIACLAYALYRQEGGVAAGLPVLGALALGAQRLLPALQQSYAAWANIVGAQASLSTVLELLDQPMAEFRPYASTSALAWQREIRLEGIRFRYGPDTPWILYDLDLVIPRGARVGLVGSTGSGKSTTLDVLMGLLAPTEGRLIVDDLTITQASIQAWQRTIAHVPQNIYLTDASFAENIAFGVPKASIDFERVRTAAKLAHIAEFIESRPDSYGGVVGERGIKLSGGQRQRIGIARALYKEATVLVFDEATSALDNATERSVMDAIHGLNRDFTILIIAHRLTTVRDCDLIVELQDGRVVAQGSYATLLETSASFRHLTSAK